MKKVVSIIAVILILGAVVLCIKQYSDNRPITKVISEDITTINIVTEANEIHVRPSKDDNIHVTINENDVQHIIVDSETLGINIPASKSPVNFDIFGSEKLTIEIPESKLDSLKISSEAGDIIIERIKAENISLNLEVGVVKLIGMEGALSAQTQMGEIKTNLPISEKTIVGNYGISSTLNCILGNEDTNQILIITTTHSDIEIE